jgi:3-hydroxybutyryl-CoA dehydratase
MNKGDVYLQTYCVEHKIYKGFIGLFKDNNPLHTNLDFALSKGFKAEVMHGNILNGFLSYFIGECLPIKNVIIQMQEIKYYLPVYLNDELKFQAEIVDIYESVNSIEFKYFFENNLGKKVAKGKIQIGII